MTSLTQATSTRSTRSISCTYSSTAPAQLLSADDVLAVVDFGEPCRDAGTPGHYKSGLLPLQDPTTVEAWRSNLPLEHGAEGGCYWSANDELLFAGLYVDEQRHPSQREAIQRAYEQLLGLVRQRGYPHLIRVWNYMADINQGSGDQERYRQFCLGRFEAFRAMGYELQQFPSACALGHSGGDTIIYLLAARVPGIHFENPLQISAYCYPGQYGPASPSFARATLANWSGGRQLYLSGTASITGHESRHDDALEKQLVETCHNIDALLQHAGKQLDAASPLRMSLLKVYLRHAGQWRAARAVINTHFGTDIPALYLQADICRRELLVEVDGICNLD